MSVEWAEFILSDDFKAYRKKQAAVITEHVHNSMRLAKTPADYERLDGALTMATKLMKLPALLVTGAGLKDQLEGQLQADFLEVTAGLIRQAIGASDADD